MMRKGLLAVMALGVSAGVTAAQNVPPVNPEGLVYATPLKDGTPNYKGYFERVFATFEPEIKKQAATPKSEAALSIEFADEALRLWKVSGDDKYLKIAQPIYDNFVAQPDLVTQFDIFKSYPLAHATLLLQAGHHVSDEQIEVVRAAFLALQAKGFELRYGNRELGVMSGMGFAAFQLFGSDAAFAPSRERLLGWWAEQNEIGDLDENAGNYSSVGLMETVRLVREMGREDDLRSSARWRNTFARLVAMVTPDGHFPEFNDDYFEEGGKTAYLYLFEYAAQLYDDPTYSYAARKMFLRRVRYLPPVHNAHVDMHDMGGIYLADDLLELKLLAEKPRPGSMVTGITHRYDAFGIEHDDKLLLRPSLAPGSPMLMMELYPWGDHAHQEMRGSITYYEVDHVPLFRGGFGRYWGRQTGDGGNAFYLQPERASFPIDQWKSGEWKTVRIDAARLPLPGDGSDQDKRVFTGLNPTGACHLGVPGKNGCYAEKMPDADTTILIDNVRLEGPAGIKMLDDFESGAVPRGAAVSSDASHGEHSLAISPASRSVTIPPPKDAEFSLKEYKVLAYDIKQTGAPMLTVDFRIPKTPNGSHLYEAWHTVAPSPFYAELKNAKTETSGRDEYAEVVYQGYGTWDSKLTRRIVLTSEGAIVVRDTFTAGENAKGWTAGAVWQIPSVEEQGKNWFASNTVEDVSLSPQDSRLYRYGELVYFAAASELESGTTKQTYQKQNRYTAWAKLPVLEAGQTVSIVTVVVPTDETSKLKAIGDAIRTVQENAGVRVMLPNGEEVTVSDTGWAVKHAK